MQLVYNGTNIKEKYKNGEIIDHLGSHYHNEIDEVIIDLHQIKSHSKDCTIEHAFIQHVMHETIHKALNNNISTQASIDFDNLCSRPTVEIEGCFTLKDWDNGIYHLLEHFTPV